MERKKLQSFKDLDVWQKSSDLTVLLYKLTERFPQSELYGLTEQLRRAAISISSNIAEGFKRTHGKEKLQFYNVAYGSAAELESQVEISYKLGYLPALDYQKMLSLTIEIAKMIDGLIKSTREPPSSKFCILFPFVFLFSIFYILNPNQALGAEIYFGSQGREIGIEKPFEVGVFLNTEGESLNAIEGEITFPIENLEFGDIRAGASIINFWIKPPSFDGSSISFSGIVPGGYLGGEGYLFSLILKPKELGQVTIGGKELRALRNDPPGSPAPMRISPLKLEIVEESQTPEFLPPYDAEPPEPFTPQIASEPSVFDGKWFLVFDTKDKGSGIDRYEVYEDLGFRIQDLGKMIEKILYPKSYILHSWSIAESPYLLKDQKLRSYIYVKAIDKAGNERVAELPPQNPLEWYENYLIWAIIIVGGILGYIIWRILWQKIKRS